MADEKADGKESTTDRKEPITTNEAIVSTVSSVASSLAGMFLEKQVRKGREIEIPSLGIKIGKANLREANGSNSPDKSDDKEHPQDKSSTSS